MTIPIQPVLIQGRPFSDVSLLTQKLANVSPSESGYEATLAKLGLHVLRDRVEELMPYFKGFQLLDMSEDGEFAAGFFVFETNGTVIDAPMFLIKGHLKGKELLFLRDKQRFIPSQSGLVTYIMSVRDQSLGTKGPKFTEQRSRKRAVPNIDVFSRSNNFMSKVSSHPAHFSMWAREAGVMESLISMHEAEKTADCLKILRDRKTLPKSDLKFWTPYPGVAEKLATWCRISPSLDYRVKKAFGPDWLDQANLERQKQAAYAKVKPVQFNLGSDYLTLKAASAGVPVVGICDSVPSFLTGSLRETAAIEVANYGGCIIDRRPETKLAMRVMDVSQEFTGPWASCIANVPMQDGGTETCYVILSRDRLLSDSKTLIISKSSGKAAEVASGEVLIKFESDRLADPSDWFKDFQSESSMAKRSVFLVIDKHGRSAGPFVSRGEMADGITEVYCASLPLISNSRNDHLPRSDSSSITRIIRSDSHTGLSVVDISLYNSHLIIPPDAKFLKLATEDRNDSDYPCSISCVSVEALNVLPSSLFDPDRYYKQAGFSLLSAPSHCILNGKAQTKFKTICQLVTDVGLTKTAAIELVERPVSRTTEKFAVIPAFARSLLLWQLGVPDAVKLAEFVRPPSEPDYGFTFPEPQTGMSDNTMPMSEQYSQVTSETSPIPRVDSTDPSYSGYYAPYEEARVSHGDQEAATSMANAKDMLWENKLFMSLIRNVRIDSQIGRQTEDMFKLVDTIGRTLFLMYAHQEEFEGMFGDKDLPQIEEQLLSLFESSGELIADLLQRNIDIAGDGIVMAIENG